MAEGAGAAWSMRPIVIVLQHTVRWSCQTRRVVVEELSLVEEVVVVVTNRQVSFSSGNGGAFRTFDGRSPLLHTVHTQYTLLVHADLPRSIVIHSISCYLFCCFLIKVARPSL
jgi:hypothetical protein